MQAAAGDLASIRSLLPNEKVVWYGRPQGGLLLMARDGLLLPFSLFWCGFAVVWEATALQARAPFPFALFGIPFLCVGLFFLFGRFCLDARLRAGTVCVLTNRRILISPTGLPAKFQAVSLDRLPEATLSKTANGRGTIRFCPQVPLFENSAAGGFGTWVAALDPTPQFVAIEEARRVFTAMQARSSA